MHVAAWPPAVDVAAGERATFQITITNTSQVIDAYGVQVFGVDPAWVELAPARLSLFPADVETVTVTVAFPADYPASSRTLAVNVRSENDPEEFALTQVLVSVRPQSHARVSVDPIIVTSGKRAVFGVVVANEGNAPIHAVAVGTDPEDLARFRFEPPAVIVPPGRTQVVRTTVEGGRAWFGVPRARVLTLGVEADQRVESVATWVQRPRIGRGLMALLGLLLAGAVFAAVLSRAFGQVVEQASVDDQIIENALASGEAGGAVVPVNPAGITGTVVSVNSGDPVPGVQADLFLADDTNVPIATAATDDSGTYTFARLGAGDYRLRFSGAGFDSRWFGGSTTPADAAEIETTLGEITPLDPFELGARPGSIRGEVLGEDPVGAVVTLQVQGQTDPDTPAQVAQVEASADGGFFFEEVPSPAVYVLEVRKPGFATERRDVVLGPAQALEGVEVLLRTGDGVITGTVFSVDGPLGGATVTATDGVSTISTVSLTEGEIGTYALRNLPTPGRYTVTITRDGYASESRSGVLESGQSIGGLDVTLVDAIGSISGTVSVEGAGPTGGITVTVVGGETSVETTTVTQGEVGTFRVEQLPIPASYTVTFSGPGLLGQVRLADLDARAGRVDLTGVDAVLRQDRSVVRGVVRLADDTLVSGATVELTDGTTTYEFLTADDPLGAFEFAGVPPGAYTLTAGRTGTTPVVVLVNVQASEVEEVDLRLGAQASLSGQVLRVDGPNGEEPFAGATVRLFATDAFPGAPAAALASVVTDDAGNYSFTGLDAPEDYVVAVYVAADSADPVDSALVVTEPSTDVDVPTFRVEVQL